MVIVSKFESRTHDLSTEFGGGDVPFLLGFLLVGDLLNVEDAKVMNEFRGQSTALYKQERRTSHC